jgi:hypothetical protein
LLVAPAFLSGPGWTTLIDGANGLDNWNVVGDANWRVQDGAIVADKGTAGFLVSKNAYKDFTIYAEFWQLPTPIVESSFELLTRKKLADSAYEVNIWDIRPDPSYGTGAIVNFAKVPVPIANKAGGPWNVMEVIAQGTSADGQTKRCYLLQPCRIVNFPVARLRCNLVLV